MVKEITREMLHSVLDDSIENGADTLILSKENGNIHLVVGNFDNVDYEWVSTKITTELRLVDGALDMKLFNENQKWFMKWILYSFIAYLICIIGYQLVMMYE